MEMEIVEKVINRLGSKLNAGGNFVKFGDSSCKPVELGKGRFISIGDSDTAESRRVAFIDGGNNAVIDAASFCLHMARVYSAVYSGSKREKSSKSEFLLLASSSASGIDVEAFGKEDGMEMKFGSFDFFDSTLAKQGHRADVNEAAAACRKIAELRMAAKIADEIGKGGIIVLDRDLRASVTGEKEALQELYRIALEKSVVVCGISKTTRLFTETGDSAAAAVSAIAPENEWYIPVGNAESEEHNAGIFFAKLHKASKYIFRFEIYGKQKEEAGKALAILRKNSADPVFLGYPYGMIEADRIARVGNSEAEYMRVKLISKAGRERGKIIGYMKSVDAHSVLDNIS